MRTSFGEIFDSIINTRLGELKAIDVGEVVSWDSSEQTVRVRPVLLNQDSTERAEIPNCSVVFPGVYWDVQIGEHGLLLVCDSDYRRWWRVGEDSVPETTNQHNISNSVFLPGLKTKSDSRTVPSNASVLEKPVGGGSVRLGVQSANKAVVHSDLQGALNNFLNDLTTWVGQVHAACGPLAGTAALQAEIATLAFFDYTSDTVFVED